MDAIGSKVFRKTLLKESLTKFFEFQTINLPIYLLFIQGHLQENRTRDQILTTKRDRPREQNSKSSENIYFANCRRREKMKAVRSTRRFPPPFM